MSKALAAGRLALLLREDGAFVSLRAKVGYVTASTLVRRRVLSAYRNWLCLSCLGAGACAPASASACDESGPSRCATQHPRGLGTTVTARLRRALCLRAARSR